jgi:hypothetical protein
MLKHEFVKIMNNLPTHQLQEIKEKAKEGVYLGCGKTLDKALDQVLENFIKEVQEAEKQRKLIEIGFNHAYDG